MSRFKRKPQRKKTQLKLMKSKFVKDLISIPRSNIKLLSSIEIVMNMKDKINMVFLLMISRRLNRCKMKFSNKKRKSRKSDPNGSRSRKLL